MVDYWDFKAWMPSHTFVPVQFVDWYIETRHPFLDYALVDFFAFKLPPDMRLNRKFQQKAMNYCFPNLRSIQSEHDGVSPDSAMLKSLMGRVTLYAARKTRLAVERLSGGKHTLKPIDYRDYGNWLRNESRSYVEAILLDEKTLKRGYFREEFIRDVLKEHMSGKRNHDQLICDLINFELMNRVFFQTQLIP